MVKNNQKIKVSIIILTINSKDMLLNALENISKLKTVGIDATAIVVDNGSTDGTIEKVKKYNLPNMKYKFIETGTNLGFAGGNNVGIRASLNQKDDYSIIMNDDIILEDSFLVDFVKFMQQNPDVGIASPKIYFARGHEYHKGRYSKREQGKVIWYAGGVIDWNNIYTSHRGVDEVDSSKYNETSETDLASGACMIVNNKIYEKVGFLDEGLYLYWEDADFNQRVQRSGYKTIFYPKIKVWHKVSASAGGPGSKSNDYFLVRNRYYFALRYANLRAKIAVLRDTVRLMFFGRSWQRLGALHALIGKKGAGPWIKR